MSQNRSRPSATQAPAALRDVVAALRNPKGGCQWDLRQTHDTLRSCAIEEAYEVAAAIDRGLDDELMSELGDLLFLVYLHSQIAAERGAFTVTDVTMAAVTKMKGRHPHIFDPNWPADEIPEWEELKRRERGTQRQDESRALAGVSRAQPAMMRALALSKKAAVVGFDWPDARGPLAKLREELDELEEAMTQSRERQLEEIGDVFFTLVNLARKLELDLEKGLTLTNEKFIRRFSRVERELSAREVDFEQTNLTELDALWDKAKECDSNNDTTHR